jgi:hypothetical protein
MSREGVCARARVRIHPPDISLKYFSLAHYFYSTVTDSKLVKQDENNVSNTPQIYPGKNDSFSRDIISENLPECTYNCTIPFSTSHTIYPAVR